jgi:hypothetical protein
MPPALKRLVNVIAGLALGVPLWLVMMTVVGSGIALAVWILSGGIFQILGTIITTAEASFKHDWKLPEVVLVLLVVFLVVRKR